ncbi:hypothetical protein PR048_026390 [Dryococelus australis]|uniref:Uncharacterized protein n=1 Tax=Dryococelus australis TaxID=614101 RepID=A0ABQ9GL81_9NEOP|nr:hypothetical protein PR048_026390 [Dryococelus australis]
MHREALGSTHEHGPARHSERLGTGAVNTSVTYLGVGGMVTQWLDCSPPTRPNRVISLAGSLRIFASGNCARRCYRPAGFLRDLPFLPSFHSGAAPYSPHFNCIGSQDLERFANQSSTARNVFAVKFVSTNLPRSIGEPSQRRTDDSLVSAAAVMSSREENVALLMISGTASAATLKCTVNIPGRGPRALSNRRTCCERVHTTSANPFVFVERSASSSHGARVSLGLFANRLATRRPARAVSLLAFHQGEPGSIPSRVTVFSHVGIVLDDAVGQRVSSGISRFPRPFIPALLHTLITLIGSQELAVKIRPNPLTLHSFPVGWAAGRRIGYQALIGYSEFALAVTDLFRIQQKSLLQRLKADIVTAFRREVAHIDGSHAADGISRLPHRWQLTETHSPVPAPNNSSRHNTSLASSARRVAIFLQQGSEKLGRALVPAECLSCGVSPYARGHLRGLLLECGEGQWRVARLPQNPQEYRMSDVLHISLTPAVLTMVCEIQRGFVAQKTAHAFQIQWRGSSWHQRFPPLPRPFAQLT